MIPGIYDIECYQNDTLSLTFRIEDSAGDPVSLSTATVVMQVRKKPGDPLLWEATEGNGITVGGVGNADIAVAKVVDVAKGSYQYDVQATFASGVVATYVGGAFIVKDDITE